MGKQPDTLENHPTQTLAEGDELKTELIALAIQYCDDLRRPPSDGSRGRRLAWVNGVLAKTTPTGAAQ